jgi:hypothetical protein
MPDIVRLIIGLLVIGTPAFFLTLITIGIGNFFERKKNEKLKPTYLKRIKYLTLFIGQCLGSWFFWSGFGIGMGSGENDSSWVMTYVYESLWLVIPLVSIDYLLPRIGGIGLLINGFWSLYLMNQVWVNKISFVSKDGIFIAHNGFYSLLLTELSISGFMFLLGLLFLFLGWKERTVL